MVESAALTAEAGSGRHCEGQVVTCPHCGRPANECDGRSCAHVLDTREYLLPSNHTGTARRHART
jgi:hypothetical protein